MRLVLKSLQFHFLGNLVRLKTRKRMLNCLSLLCLGIGGVAIYDGVSYEVSLSVEKMSSRKPSTTDSTSPQVSQRTVDTGEPGWQRRLQRPLYDPPPPPKKVVKKKVRPIPVKLKGTILEAENSQAFVQLSNGSVELRRVGDQLTSDPLDGKVTQITATEIVVEREDGEFQVAVDGQR